MKKLIIMLLFFLMSINLGWILVITGNEHDNESDNLCNLGVLYINKGEYPKALKEAKL